MCSKNNCPIAVIVQTPTWADPRLRPPDFGRPALDALVPALRASLPVRGRLPAEMELLGRYSMAGAQAVTLLATLAAVSGARRQFRFFLHRPPRRIDQVGMPGGGAWARAIDGTLIP